MLFGAAVMETDRMIPSASQNGSPGSQQSGGSTGVQQAQGMMGAPPPLPPPMQSHQPALPPLPMQQQQYIGSMTRKKKTERLVPPILNPQSLIDDATAAAQSSYANHSAVYANGRPFYSDGGGGRGGGVVDAPPGILVNSSASIAGHTNHGYSQENGCVRYLTVSELYFGTRLQLYVPYNPLRQRGRPTDTTFRNIERKITSFQSDVATELLRKHPSRRQP